MMIGIGLKHRTYGALNVSKEDEAYYGGVSGLVGVVIILINMFAFLTITTWNGPREGGLSFLEVGVGTFVLFLSIFLGFALFTIRLPQWHMRCAAAALYITFAMILFIIPTLEMLWNDFRSNDPAGYSFILATALALPATLEMTFRNPLSELVKRLTTVASGLVLLIALNHLSLYAPIIREWLKPPL